MNNQGKVLLVEDNRNLNTANLRALKMRGYSVLAALTLEEARKHLMNNNPDVILLDVVLPDGNGFDFCSEIRENTNAHILFLTSRTEHEDRVKGLLTGGDDYITKPYHPEEMLARVAAAMRRRKIEAKKTLPKTIVKGPLTLDVVASQAFLNGEDMGLALKEFAVLLLLANNEGKDLTAERVYQDVWHQSMEGNDHSVKNVVYRLRKKLETGNSGFSIFTKRGIGYSFDSIE